MESGTALFADVQTTPKKNALFFAQQVNSTLNESSSSELIVQVLQAADAELLVTLSLASQTDNSTMVSKATSVKKLVIFRCFSVFSRHRIGKRYSIFEQTYVRVILGRQFFYGASNYRS